MQQSGRWQSPWIAGGKSNDRLACHRCHDLLRFVARWDLLLLWYHPPILLHGCCTLASGLCAFDMWLFYCYCTSYSNGMARHGVDWQMLQMNDLIEICLISLSALVSMHDNKFIWSNDTGHATVLVFQMTIDFGCHVRFTSLIKT